MGKRHGGIEAERDIWERSDQSRERDRGNKEQGEIERKREIDG